MISVVVPYRPGCPHREAAWRWARPRWEAFGEVITATGPEGPFSRSAAILEAAEQATSDVLVVADADVWADPTEAIEATAEHGWAVPHLLVHRLSRSSTEQVIAGADWRGLPLSDDNAQDRKPYRGNETGTLLVIRRDVLDDVPPDRRFRGWGQEDQAHGAALRTLIGAPWRGALDLVHLWHPPQPRLTRVVGSDQSNALWRRYARARRNPQAMRALVEEGRHGAQGEGQDQLVGRS